jgi:hypothetical protein
LGRQSVPNTYEMVIVIGADVVWAPLLSVTRTVTL